MRAGDLRPNDLFKLDGQFYKVLEFQRSLQHRVSIINVKIQNIETGGVQDCRFKPTDFFDEFETTRRYMKFSYEDNGVYYFTEEETWETEPAPTEMAKAAILYNSEEDPAIFTFEYAEGKLLGINPPTFVILRVTDTEPSTAGDTARNALKKAKLESGLVIKVQMFIKNGDRIRIDTRTGEYVDRA